MVLEDGIARFVERIICPKHVEIVGILGILFTLHYPNSTGISQVLNYNHVLDIIYPSRTFDLSKGDIFGAGRKPNPHVMGHGRRAPIITSRAGFFGSFYYCV